MQMKTKTFVSLSQKRMGCARSAHVEPAGRGVAVLFWTLGRNNGFPPICGIFGTGHSFVGKIMRPPAMARQMSKATKFQSSEFASTRKLVKGQGHFIWKTPKINFKNHPKSTVFNWCSPIFYTILILSWSMCLGF